MSLNVELLESSFAQIKEREADFSAHFYANLFVDHPIVKPLFTNSCWARLRKSITKEKVDFKTINSSDRHKY